VPPNPADLLSTGRFHAIVREASALYDVVIIDAPPVLEYADAQMIASRAGGYVLVTRRNRTRLADITAVQERLEPSGAVLLGAIVND
jgi:receptor protein-tyrosine kinase